MNELNETEWLVPVIDVELNAAPQRTTLPNIKALAESIIENGLIQPIVLTENKSSDKPWMLVAGRRRYTAYMYILTTAEYPEEVRAKYRSIPAVLKAKLSFYQQRKIELEENVQREDLPWNDQVRAKADLMELYRKENPHITVTEAAERMKDSKATTSRDLKLAAAINKYPELAKASSKKAAMRQAEMLAHLQAKVSALNTVDLDYIKNNIVTADAVDFVKTLPNDSVDLFLVDFPYGIDYFDQPSSDRQAGGGMSKFDDSFDAARKLVLDVMPDVLRAAKPTAWLLFFAGRELELTILETIYRWKPSDDSNKDKKPDMATIPWIWHRPNSRSHSIAPDKVAQHTYEPIYVINMGKAKFYKEAKDVLVFDAEYNNRMHAHEKPIELAKELISRTTFPQDMVVDFCFGSGKLLAGAAALTRRFTGCDNNPGMLGIARGNIAEQYINSKETQMSLLDNTEPKEEPFVPEDDTIPEDSEGFEDYDEADDEDLEDAESYSDDNDE